MLLVRARKVGGGSGVQEPGCAPSNSVLLSSLSGASLVTVAGGCWRPGGSSTTSRFRRAKMRLNDAFSNPTDRHPDDRLTCDKRNRGLLENITRVAIVGSRLWLRDWHLEAKDCHKDLGIFLMVPSPFDS